MKKIHKKSVSAEGSFGLIGWQTSSHSVHEKQKPWKKCYNPVQVSSLNKKRVVSIQIEILIYYIFYWTFAKKSI